MTICNLPVPGSPEFWALYDAFCTPEVLAKLGDKETPEALVQMRRLMEEMQRAGELKKLSRPERGWTYYKAWLMLNSVQTFNLAGDVFGWMNEGDVIVVEHGWDRDVVITHVPIERNLPCGFLVGGPEGGALIRETGVFLPLFDRETIMMCIQLRLARNVHEATALATQESQDWGWF